jgi:hypothetical protein
MYGSKIALTQKNHLSGPAKSGKMLTGYFHTPSGAVVTAERGGFL